MQSQDYSSSDPTAGGTPSWWSPARVNLYNNTQGNPASAFGSTTTQTDPQQSPWSGTNPPSAPVQSPGGQTLYPPGWNVQTNSPGTSGSGNPTDPAYILQQLQAKFGNDWKDSQGSGLDYYAQRIQQTGGWTDQNSAYWIDRMGKEATGSVPAESGGGGTASLDLSTSVLGASNPLTQQSSALYDFLMQRAQQSETVDPNDPTIKGQVDAYGAQQQQSQRNYLSQLAESRGNYANIGAETRASSEQVGQATSGFQSQLMSTELAARRQEIESALSGAAGLLTGEQQMALTEELSKIQTAQQAYEFDLNQQYLYSPFGPNA